MGSVDGDFAATGGASDFGGGFGAVNVWAATPSLAITASMAMAAKQKPL
jgi:hypothetical protein